MQKNAQQVTTVTFPIFFAKHKIDHSGGGGGGGIISKTTRRIVLDDEIRELLSTLGLGGRNIYCLYRS